MRTQPMPHRVTFGVDIEGYSKRSNPEQVELQARLCWITERALTAAGVNPKRCGRQDQGDAQLISLPAGADLAGVLPALPRVMQAAIHQVNSVPVSAGRLRLRMSMAQGPVQIASTGFVGPGVISAAWILESQTLRDALRASPQADLVIAITDDLYRQVFRQGYGGLAAGDFRSALIENPAKNFAVHVWIYVPSSQPDPALVPAFTRPGGGDLTALWAAAIPLAGLGTGIWIEHHQNHPVPGHTASQNDSAGDPHAGSEPGMAGPHAAGDSQYDAGVGQLQDDQHEASHHDDSHGRHHGAAWHGLADVADPALPEVGFDELNLADLGSGDPGFSDSGLPDSSDEASFADPGGNDAQYLDFGADSGDPGVW
jgi:hypothetical protein